MKLILKNNLQRSGISLAMLLLWYMLLSTLSMIPAYAEDAGEVITLPNGYSEDGLWLYNDYGDGTVSVTCQDNTLTEAEIPAEIDGHTITMVEVDCFKDNPGLQKVTLPDTITVIEDYSFYQCYGLEEINIPESVTKIGFQAFYGCALREVTIPAGVTEIESFAFEGCNSLQAIHVSKANQNYLDQDGILFDYDKTTLIVYPSAKTDTSYTIPENCTKLESYAFMGNQYLEQIDISSVQEMGEDVFYYCTSLQEITIPDGITELKGSAFGNCTALRKITLPEGITNLGSGCFYNCVMLEEIQLPESLTGMNDYAFFNCGSLKRLTIPENVTTIGNYALGWYYGSDNGNAGDENGEQDDYKRLPDFEIDADNGTAAFAYAARNSIKCTGGITQGIVFVYIVLGVVALVILAVIGLVIMQKRYQKEHELN
ncbi:MAG: leucine-rich repeat domain-containing protein [Oscillospiraceae bacterium]|nr:leucine-rich repeat domain-containing protein [Oscillospiraceae bacterium]